MQRLPFPEEGLAELACWCTQIIGCPARVDELLGHVEDKARAMHIGGLFALSTRTTHWFRERGFQNARWTAAQNAGATSTTGGGSKVFINRCAARRDPSIHA